MDIKAFEAHVEAVIESNNQGIFSVYSDGSVHVTDETLIELSHVSPQKISVEEREDVEAYPIKVSLEINGRVYYAVCDEVDYINKFGGNLNELITTNRINGSGRDPIAGTTL